MTAETAVGRARSLPASVSTADAPTATRVRVWHKPRSLGALYLRQAVCLLPDREPSTACGGTS
ncbi:hypothetical protein [Streptomyces sirii]|uniref:hypothetical protein n=1 Tax=Streptomyces sirii TaxID=3127701 RepID=UPI003D36FC88